ncbi:MAG: enoyl-CoA hydratase-related protein [Aliidongia sp.]
MGGSIHRRDLADGIVVLELDNPPMNAMSANMLARATEAFAAIEQDLARRVVVLTGRGRALLQRGRSQGGGRRRRGSQHLRPAARRCGAMPGPGDRRDQRALHRRRFRAGAVLRPAHRLDRGAIHLCRGEYRADGLDLAPAAPDRNVPRQGDAADRPAPGRGDRGRLGLVTAVHPPGQLDAAALALAARIATRAPLSVEASKRVASRAMDLSAEEATGLIAHEMPVLQHSRDPQEALAAFAEKRAPVFQRR